MTRSFLFSLLTCVLLALTGALSPVSDTQFDEEEGVDQEMTVERAAQAHRYRHDPLCVNPVGLELQVPEIVGLRARAGRVPARHWRQALLPRDDGGSQLV